MTDLSDLLRSVGTLLWPLLALAALLVFYRPISRRIDQGGFTVEWGDKKLTVAEATEQLRRVVGSLADQAAARQNDMATPAAPGPAEASASRLEPAPASVRQLLWVDDRPSNNAFEMAQLRDRGVTIVEARSTEEALRTFSSSPTPFDAVITDMGRREDGHYVPDAGLDLIRKLKSSSPQVPVFVYSTGRVARERGQEVLDAGGRFATSSPVTLFSALQG